MQSPRLDTLVLPVFTTFLRDVSIAPEPTFSSLVMGAHANSTVPKYMQPRGDDGDSAFTSMFGGPKYMNAIKEIPLPMLLGQKSRK